MTLFRLDASIRMTGSHSRSIADIVECEWTATGSGGEIVRRDVGSDPVDATTWATAALAAHTPAEARTAQQRTALRLAATLANELIGADEFLFAVPLYNYGVSQHFKTWVDTVIADPRFDPSVPSPIADRRAVLVSVQGGNYAPGTPREGWDHATGWMHRILADVWSLDVTMIQTPFTLVGENPALDQYTDLAANIRDESERLARQHGIALRTVPA